jgi:hypothetical protein
LRILLSRFSEVIAMVESPGAFNAILHRYVNIPCPSGRHSRSVVTFRNHTVAAMFCIPCEQAWTELTSHPELRDISLDEAVAQG